MLILLLALIWDLTFGELPNALHPVAWMGHVISMWRDHALRLKSPTAQFIAGPFMALGIPLLFAIATVAILKLTIRLPWLNAAISIFLLQATFALRELGAAAKRVAGALNQGDLSSARFNLRSLCSRDASQLDSSQLVSATIGSLAENISDSFIAPMFFYALFGIPGAVFYRAVNTMDAMIGYRGRYEYVGKAAARTDDLLNFIPARLTAALLLLAGWLRGYPARLGLNIMLRDHNLTPSPNGGWPMAAMAGLLEVEINKVDCYALGDQKHELTPAMVDSAWTLTLLAGLVLSVVILIWTGVTHGIH